jgi:hypothetical protein
VNTEHPLDPLEQALVSAGRAMTYPATPSIATRLQAQLKQLPAPLPPTPRGSWWATLFGTRQRLAWSLMIALVLAIALLLAFPDARNAIAQFFGLNTIRIIPVTPTPTPTALPTPLSRVTPLATPTPTPVPTPRAQCCETTLANAQTRAKFKIVLPPNQTPSRVHLQNVFDQWQQIILVFGDPNNPTFTLYQAHNVVYGKLVTANKSVGPGTVIEETRVGHLRALWITGEPHVLVYLDARGQPVFDTERVVDANTLAWESVVQGLTYRLETKRSKEEAIRFAESLQ